MDHCNRALFPAHVYLLHGRGRTGTKPGPQEIGCACKKYVFASSVKFQVESIKQNQRAVIPNFCAELSLSTFCSCVLEATTFLKLTANYISEFGNFKCPPITRHNPKPSKCLHFMADQSLHSRCLNTAGKQKPGCAAVR